jgi:ATP-dependent Lon protease
MESKSQKSADSASVVFTIPGEMPMIVLSDCFLLPGCFLPLFIFEERYRLMLDHALRHDRMFCVGIRKKASDENSEVLPCSTAGLVRACVRNPDGTSQLMLYGLKRIEITGWAQETPFRIAQIREVETEVCPPSELEALRARAVSLLPVAPDDACDAVKLLREAANNIPDPERLCDILAYHFVKKASLMKVLMSERSVEKRYRLLIAELQSQQ